MPRLQAVAKEITDDVVIDNSEMIMKYVYDAGTPSEYERTYEFASAWKSEEAGRNGKETTAEFSFQPDMITEDIGNFQHGSPYGELEGSDALPNIIFEGKSGSLFGDGYWRYKRNAWFKLRNNLFKSKKLDTYAKRGFKRNGIEAKLQYNITTL